MNLLLAKYLRPWDWLILLVESSLRFESGALETSRYLLMPSEDLSNLFFMLTLLILFFSYIFETDYKF
jgi:hypothetical protein